MDDRPHEVPVLLARLGPDMDLTLDPLGEHASTVFALAFTPDGQRLVTGGSPIDGGAQAELICWDLQMHSVPRWRIGYPAPIMSIAISPDGRWIALGGTDGVLRLLSFDHPSEILSSVDVGVTIARVVFAHHAPLVAVTHLTDCVRLFEIANNAFVPRADLRQPGSALSAVAFGPTDDTLYFTAIGGVRRWDVHANKPVDPVIPFVDRVKAFGLDPHPESVIAVTGNGRIILRRVSNL
jgi:WD40 repeat protein